MVDLQCCFFFFLFTQGECIEHFHMLMIFHLKPAGNVFYLEFVTLTEQIQVKHV